MLDSLQLVELQLFVLSQAPDFVQHEQADQQRQVALFDAGFEVRDAL